MLSRTSTDKCTFCESTCHYMEILSCILPHLLKWKESDDTAVKISKPKCNYSINIEEINPDLQCINGSVIFTVREKL